MNDVLREIDVHQAARLAHAGEVLLLDVREDHEWELGRAPGARHLPLGALGPGVVPADRPVIAVCRSGNRSGKATTLLAAAGYDVTNLSGGMLAWEAAGFPVVDGNGRPGTVA